MPRFRNGLARVGKIYYYCFRINGRQFKGSTRASDRATAEQVVVQKRKEALLGPQAKPVPIPTVRKLTEAWSKSYKSTYSPRHVESVESFAKVWINPALGDLQVNRVSTQAVLDLRQKMLDLGRSKATVNLMLRILKLLMSYAVRLGHIEHRPFNVPPLRIQRKPRPTIPAERVGEFFSALDAITTSPQVRTMIRMMVGLGLRASEVQNARWEWISIERRTYTVGKAKGKEARVLPIPAWLWNQLAQPPETLSGWIFPGEDGKPHSRTFLLPYLAKISTKLGIQKLTQHRLRATFATLHAEAGTPVPEIQGMLGHKQVTTTMIYIEQSLEAKRRSQDALSERLGLA